MSGPLTMLPTYVAPEAAGQIEPFLPGEGSAAFYKQKAYEQGIVPGGFSFGSNPEPIPARSAGPSWWDQLFSSPALVSAQAIKVPVFSTGTAARVSVVQAGTRTQSASAAQSAGSKAAQAIIAPIQSLFSASAAPGFTPRAGPATTAFKGAPTNWGLIGLVGGGLVLAIIAVVIVSRD